MCQLTPPAVVKHWLSSAILHMAGRKELWWGSILTDPHGFAWSVQTTSDSTGWRELWGRQRGRRKEETSTTILILSIYFPQAQGNIYSFFVTRQQKHSVTREQISTVIELGIQTLKLLGTVCFSQFFFIFNPSSFAVLSSQYQKPNLDLAKQVLLFDSSSVGFHC